MSQESKMPLDGIIHVTSSVGDQRVGHGKMHVRKFNINERFQNAFKRLLLFWLAAGVCAFIPAVHFILVPLFLVLGLIGFGKALKIEAKIISGKGSCPSCHAMVNISSGLLTWPCKEICQSCGRAVRFELKDKPEDTQK